MNKINLKQYIVDRRGFKFFFFVFILFTIYNLLPSAPTLAQTSYELLAPIPITESGCIGAANEVCKTDVSKYIRGIFILVIMIAGGLAVIQIILGGIQYMSTDAFGEKNDAKNTISNAIWGLLLAISAWLILNTINPELTKFNFSIKTQAVSSSIPGSGSGSPSGGGILPGYTLTQAQLTQDQAMRASLNPLISVPDQPCATGGTSGCTNIVGLSPKAISGVDNLATSCQCKIAIYGGSEGGHASHGPGLAQVDLGLNKGLNDHIINNGKPTTAVCGVPGASRYSLNGAIYVNEGNHWHACY